MGEPIAFISFILVCAPNHPLTQLSLPLDPNALAQELQIVIKDSAKTPEEKTGWLRSENRWTVSHFDYAIELLLQGIGFCWLPEHTVSELIKTGKLTSLTVEGSYFKQFTAYLISPTPDNQGPGTKLLEKLILQHREIDLPSS